MAALAASARDWFVDQIVATDPSGRSIIPSKDKARLVYNPAIRSDENRDRPAEDEELVRGLIVALLCSDKYGYEPERLYLEQSHSIGRPSTSGAQVDLLLYYLEDDGSESAFAMWEIKATDRYSPEMDQAIEHQLFATAPLIMPSLLVYATVKPPRSDIECLTIDYKAYKSFQSWDDAGRPHT